MKVRSSLLLAACHVAAGVAHADVDATDISQVPIEALLNTPTTVASTKATVLRESPGVVTVITQGELERMGARDLTDVLHLVPGFEMAVDVSGGVGIGFRGNWAHEGKVLLLVDGVEFNEILYYTTVFGHHFPMNDIDRIEIIRGPGSATYGGAAELAVINVITTSGAARRSIAGYGSAGHTGTVVSRLNGGLSYGQAFDDGVLEGLDLTADVYGGTGIRSDGTYTDVFGTSYDMSRASQLDPLFVNLGGRYKGLEARFIFDYYRTTQQDGYTEALERPFSIDFPAWFFNLKYVWKLSDTLTLTPRVELKRQNPWRNLDAEPPVQLNLVATRAKAGLVLQWDPTPSLNLIGGLEGFVDHVQDGEESVASTLASVDFASYGGADNTFQNGAAFGQLLLKTDYFNLTAGARGELHSSYGGSFVPRVAMTKVFDRMHLKMLVSGAFKAPSIYNIIVSPDIRPEQARVLEAEAGVQLTDFLYVTGNLFDITVLDPIVYKFENDTDTFKNFTQTGSRGIEIEALMKVEQVQMNLAYSFYTSESKNEVDIYQVPGHDELNLAFPQHKISGSVSYFATKDISLTGTFALRSERYAEVAVDDEGGPIFDPLPPTALVNTVAYCRDLGIHGLDVSLGVYNLLGDKFLLPQAYYADHAPLPAEPFEVMAKVRYRFDL